MVSAARYGPQGDRSVGGILHAANFDTTTGEYYKNANDEILVVLMAEHVDAIERADEICSVPGIDAVFIGPNDLHNSMGLPPAFESDHPDFLNALERILECAQKNGVAAGIHVPDASAAKRRLAEGFQFVAVASDAGNDARQGRRSGQEPWFRKRPGDGQILAFDYPLEPWLIPNPPQSPGDSRQNLCLIGYEL